jgi:hypothetical protein
VTGARSGRCQLVGEPARTGRACRGPGTTASGCGSHPSGRGARSPGGSVATCRPATTSSATTAIAAASRDSSAVTGPNGCATTDSSSPSPRARQKASTASGPSASTTCAPYASASRRTRRALRPGASTNAYGRARCARKPSSWTSIAPLASAIPGISRRPGEDAAGGAPRGEAAAAPVGRGLVPRRLRARGLEPCAARRPRGALVRAREPLGTALPHDGPRPQAVERSRDERRIAHDCLAGSGSRAGSRGSGQGSRSGGCSGSTAGFSIGSEKIRREGPFRVTRIWCALRPSVASYPESLARVRRSDDVAAPVGRDASGSSPRPVGGSSGRRRRPPINIAPPVTVVTPGAVMLVAPPLLSILVPGETKISVFQHDLSVCAQRRPSTRCATGGS